MDSCITNRKVKILLAQSFFSNQYRMNFLHSVNSQCKLHTIVRVYRQFQFPVGHTYHRQIQCVARQPVGLPSRDASFLPPARVEACVDTPNNQSNK